MDNQTVSFFLERNDFIAQAHRRAADYFRVDAQITMSIRFQQRLRNSKIPQAIFWIDVSCRASACLQNDLRPRAANLDLLADPTELVPRRRSAEIDVRPEAHWIENVVHDLTQRIRGTQIDQRDGVHPRGRIGGYISETYAVAYDQFGLRIHLFAPEMHGEKIGKTFLLKGVLEHEHRRRLAALRQSQSVALRIVRTRELREPFVFQKRHEIGLWPGFVCRCVERPAAIRDGEFPVIWKAAPRLEANVLKSFSRQTLDRIPIQQLDVVHDVSGVNGWKIH